jgi:plasmid stabilization system protein ParE
MAQKESYEVIIAKSAMLRYQEEILPYLLLNFSLDRSLEIDTNIKTAVLSLANQPYRGSKEKFLSNELD